MKIDKNSYGTVFGVLAGVVLAVFLFIRFIPNIWISFPLCLFAVWFGIFVVCFFRVPVRKPAGSSTIVTSAADGKVKYIGPAYEGEFLKRDCLKVSVYMNFFDMHANFWPVDGEVSYYKYHPGKHMLVIKPKASELNEHTCTCIRTPEGKDVFFKQIAGGFARRIVNYAKPGMKVKSGRQCGIIKFGSQMDIYLPLDAKIKVSLNESTRSAETIIAEL